MQHVLDALVVPVFKEGDAAGGTPDDVRETAEWVAREMRAGKLFSATTHLLADADNATRLVVVNAGKRDDFNLERAWQTASAGVRALWSSDARRIGVVVATDGLAAAAAVQAAVEGIFFALWRPEAHRTNAEQRRLPPIEDVQLIMGDGQGELDEAVRRGTIVGEAVNWARALANEPANKMTPTLVAEAAQALAADAGLAIEVLDEDECRELGMGSYLSVAQGSDQPAKFIVVRHHGRGGEGYDLGLVGKGITFDSGGISIKPSQDMHLMKYDMSGAATVLASMSAIARLELGLNVICVAPCTENLPGGHATKPGDVFTSMSGKTVEVINTDAEGRLVLIDGVSYAQREGAATIVDVATLTGRSRWRSGTTTAASSAARTASSMPCVAPVSRAASASGRCRSRTSIATTSRATSPTSRTAPAGWAVPSTARPSSTRWLMRRPSGHTSTSPARRGRRRIVPSRPKVRRESAVRTIVELASSIASRSR